MVVFQVKFLKALKHQRELGLVQLIQVKKAAASIKQNLGNNLVLHLDGTWRESKDYRIPGFAESEIFHESEEDHDEDHDEDHR